MPLEPWQLFWAKTDRDTRGADEHDAEWTRPLWAHLLDVGHTALLLWERVVPDGLRRQAAASLGLTDREAGSWLAFWIGLHDLGKAIPSFQFQDPNAAYLRRMRADGFTLEPGSLTASSRLHHGHATIAILSRDLTGGDPDAPLQFKESLGAFVGFHHGRLLDRTAWRRHALSDAVLGGPHWAHAQGVLLRAVYAAWAERYGLTAPRCEPEPAPAWLLGLAGWATLGRRRRGKDSPDLVVQKPEVQVNGLILTASLKKEPSGVVRSTGTVTGSEIVFGIARLASGKGTATIRSVPDAEAPTNIPLPPPARPN